MSKKIRILAALLAAVLAVGPLASCANEGDTNETRDPTITQAPVGEVDTEIKDELPDDLDYNNTEITIISRDMEGWTRGEVSVEGLNSDPVNDAIFERNKAVEAAPEHQDQQHPGQQHQL